MLHKLFVPRCKILFFRIKNSFRSLTSNRFYTLKKNDNQDLDPTVEKLRKFSIRKVRINLCQITFFEVKNATENH